MFWLPVYTGAWASNSFFCNCGIEEGEFVVAFRLHGKASGRLLVGKCFKKLSTLSKARMVKVSAT